MKKLKKITLLILVVALVLSGCNDQGKTHKPVFNPSGTSEKVQLTLGGIDIPDSIKEWTRKYNQSQKACVITIVDYRDATEAADARYEDLVAKMNVDIVAGDCPDIIYLNDTVESIYTQKELLYNLLPAIEKEHLFDDNQYFTHVWELEKTGNAMYGLPIDFSVAAAIVPSTYGVEGNAITKDTAERLLKENSDSVLYGETTQELLCELLKDSAQDFIDYENGQCSLGQEYIDLIHFCSLDRVARDENRTKNPLIRNEEYIGFMKIGSLGRRYSEKMDFVNPYSEVEKGIGIHMMDTLAISTRCESKEQAWEYLASFLGDDFQNEVDYYNDCLPIKKTSFQLMASRMQEEESGFGIEIDGKMVENVTVSDDEINQLEELINRADHKFVWDLNVNGIITEEAEKYFDGKQTLEQAMQYTTKRVNTYLNEQR